MKIGFVGAGRMGSGMARNLLRAGHEVIVYNRTRDKALGLAAEGHDSVFELLAAVTGFLVGGLSEYSFGDSEVVMLAWTIMALPSVVAKGMTDPGTGPRTPAYDEAPREAGRVREGLRRAQ